MLAGAFIQVRLETIAPSASSGPCELNGEFADTDNRASSAVADRGGHGHCRRAALLVFIGFSDDRGLVVFTLVLFVFVLVIVIIVVGIAGRDRVTHEAQKPSS